MNRLLIACALALGACDGTGPASAGGGTAAPAMAPVSLPAFFDCLRQSGAVAVSAHRGGPAPGFAENALATFENTISNAPAFLEVDVSRTGDGVLVLMHDDRVERTTTGEGALSDLTLAALQRLALEDRDGRAVGARAPTLREALDWANGRAILELDVKRAVAYEDVVREVGAADAMGRVVFITYSIDGAARLARLAPAAMIYTTISSPRELDVLERRGVKLSHIVAWVGADAPDASLVEALAARGVEARFGMFGEERDYANAIRVQAQIVAVDNAAEAVRDLDAADGEEGYGALQCATLQSPTGRYDRWINEE